MKWEKWRWMDGWMCGYKRTKHTSVDQTLMHNDREGNHGG
jgi:hypothetical protein